MGASLRPVSDVDALREQIIRDAKVLREDPIYHVPNTQFFIDRIAGYRESLARLEGK